jgi:predicted peptidase
MIKEIERAPTADVRRGDTGFLDRTASLGSRDFRYQVYVPRGYEPNRSWPLILFLHGSGERGEDGLRQTQVGLAAAIRRHVERFPAVVVFPQVPADQSWQTPKMASLAIMTLRRTMREFRIHPGRRYLTGISMGGTGVWSIGVRHPGLFAALVPVCGGLQFPAMAGGPPESPANVALCAELAAHIGDAPVWIFHGAEDPVVPVGYARQMAQALETRASPVRYTEFPQEGHGIWDRVYDDEDFCAWLFAQRSPGR